jgi:hypothetical protein
MAAALMEWRSTLNICLQTIVDASICFYGKYAILTVSIARKLAGSGSDKNYQQIGGVMARINFHKKQCEAPIASSRGNPGLSPPLLANRG